MLAHKLSTLVSLPLLPSFPWVALHQPPESAFNAGPYADSFCCIVLAVLAVLSPGGYFDPLNLAGGDDADKVFRLKTAEIKHGRLAMVAFAGGLWL
jgi:hypothetical protein